MDTFRVVADALEGASPITPPRVERGYSGVLAVDRWRRWGAAFYLRVDATGHWSSDLYLGQLDEVGRWQPIGDGGINGEEWPSAGWRPTVSASKASLGQLQGVDVEDLNGDDVELVARAGYAGDAVRAVEVAADGMSRTVEIKPELGAFVVVGPRGVWTITALDENGNRLDVSQHPDPS